MPYIRAGEVLILLLNISIAYRNLIVYVTSIASIGKKISKLNSIRSYPRLPKFKKDYTN